MKTRSSSGVGQKVDLEFDMESLRIRDLGEDYAGQGAITGAGSSMYDTIKAKSNMVHSTPDDADEGPVPQAQVESTKLKQMLAGLKAK